MLITIATFQSPSEAHLLQSRLQAEGVAAFVVDEHMISMVPYYSQAIGGVKVQVRIGELDAALEIVKKIDSGWYTKILSEYSDDLLQERCPGCGSSAYDSRASASSRFWLVLSWFLAGIVSPLPKPVHECRECGRVWQN